MSTPESSQSSGRAVSNLRPFAPGQSGNPSGQPKGLLKRVRELVGNDGTKIADYMFEVLEDDKAPRRDRMVAAAWLADRGFGKAVAVHHVDAPGSGARFPMLDLSKFTNEQLDAYIELVEIATPGDTHPVIDQQ